MDKRRYELLSCIKQRYADTNGSAAFQAAEAGPSASARQFYLRDLKDNLVRPMDERHVAEYSRGSGSELDGKMRALRSSSAMTFNLLGNQRCKVRRTDRAFASLDYAIAYEYQIPTLRRGLPANLDAVLKGGRGDVVACEMKMLEWLTSVPAKLKGRYLEPESYPFADSAPTFIEAAARLNASPAFACYDFAQMFKHALALHNAVRDGRLPAKGLVLLNCVWEPPESYGLTEETAGWVAQQARREHEGFQEFKQVMEPVERLFAHELGTSFSIEYLPASELIDRLRHPDGELARLMRYR